MFCQRMSELFGGYVTGVVQVLYLCGTLGYNAWYSCGTVTPRHMIFLGFLLFGIE